MRSTVLWCFLYVALSIATLSLNHGTEQFLKFLSTLKNFVASARDGTFFETNSSIRVPLNGNLPGTQTTSRSSPPDAQTSSSSNEPNDLSLPQNNSKGAPNETHF